MEGKVDASIPLSKDSFSRSKGLFVEVYKGNLTEIVKRLNSREYQDEKSGQQSKIEIEQII